MDLTKIYLNSAYGMMGRTSMYFRFNESIRTFLNSMLPNHLYILKNYQIVYLDIPPCMSHAQIELTTPPVQYHGIPYQPLNSRHNLTQPYTIGTVIDDPSKVVPVLMNVDIFWVRLRGNAHTRWLAFHHFLETIGEDSSEYKELVVLTIGENPFKRDLYGGFNDYTIG